MTKALHRAKLAAYYASASGSPINDGWSAALPWHCEEITYFS